MTREASRWEWRFLPTGKARHLLAVVSDAVALCGVGTLPASNWQGTGSQGEYERVGALPPCRRCLRKQAEG